MNSLKQLFQFLLAESIELDEAKFNPDVLDKLGSPEQMVMAVVGKLPLLGDGSSRAVFLLDSKRALKIARNEKGFAQNQAEAELANTPGVSPLVTRVFRTSPTYSWMISELVRPVKSDKEFQQLTQVPWTFVLQFLNHYENLGDIGDAFSVTVKAQIEKDKRAKLPSPGMSVRGIEHVPFIGRLFTALANRPDLIPADLKVLGHWGKTPDQRIVLLDSGYTEEVWANHYIDR